MKKLLIVISETRGKHVFIHVVFTSRLGLFPDGGIFVEGIICPYVFFIYMECISNLCYLRMGYILEGGFIQDIYLMKAPLNQNRAKSWHPEFTEELT